MANANITTALDVHQILFSRRKKALVFGVRSSACVKKKHLATRDYCDVILAGNYDHVSALFTIGNSGPLRKKLLNTGMAAKDSKEQDVSVGQPSIQQDDTKVKKKESSSGTRYSGMFKSQFATRQYYYKP